MDYQLCKEHYSRKRKSAYAGTLHSSGFGADTIARMRADGATHWMMGMADNGGVMLTGCVVLTAKNAGDCTECAKA